MIDKMHECVKYAEQEKGIDQIDIVSETSNTVSASVRGGKLESFDDAQKEVIGIRIIRNKRQAIISKSKLDNYKEDLDLLIKMTENLPEDEYVSMFGAEEPVQNAVFDDINIQRPSKDSLVQMALEMENGAISAGASNVELSLAKYIKKEYVFLSSIGFSGEFKKSYMSYYVSSVANKNGSMEQGDRYKIFCTPPTGFAEIGMDAGEKAVTKLGSRKIKSGKMPVIIDRIAAGDFLGTILDALNGTAISMGTSLFCGKINENCFNTNISILDDPLVQNGVNSRTFDAEGLRPDPIYLVRHGHIRNYILDGYTARKLKLPNNKRASRSAASIPYPSSTNVTLQPTSKSKSDAISSIQYGLYVTDFIGMGINLLTGSYSRGCCGFMIENGKITYPVNEVTFSCDLATVYKVMTPLDDLIIEFGVDSPSIYIDEVMIGGL